MISSSALGETVSRVAVTVAVVGFLAACKKFMGTPKADFATAETAHIRIPSVITVNLCMLVVAVIFALVTHSFLVVANRYVATRVPDIELVLYPSSAIWWFLPGFGGICLCWEITLRLWNAFNRKQAQAYRAYSNVKSGFDSTKVLRWMAIVVVIPIGVASILAIPIHSTLTHTEIRDGHFASFHDAIFPYARAIELIRFDGSLNRDGTLYPRAGIVVRFSDGKTWNSADSDDPKPTVDPALVSILVKRTGLPVEYTRLQPK